MNKFFTKSILIVASLIVCLSAEAQDARFSQFWANPMRLNPAMTGVFKGKFRATGNYRDQWSTLGRQSGFRTYSIGAEMKFRGSKNDLIGVGGYVLNDRAGGDIALMQTEGIVSFSYQKMLGKPKGWIKGNKYLVGGIQAGFGQRTLDWAQARTQSQFNGNGYDATLGNGEASQTRSRAIPNANMGVMYYVTSGERSSVYGGIAIHNITQPQVNLGVGKADRLFMRYTVHGGAEIPMGGYRSRSPWSVLPSAVFCLQGPSMYGTAGASFKYKQAKNGDFAFRLGGYANYAGGGLSDAIFAAGLELGRIQVGISYDAVVNQFSSAVGGRGALELSLMYTDPNFGKRAQGCPTF